MDAIEPLLWYCPCLLCVAHNRCFPGVAHLAGQVALRSHRLGGWRQPQVGDARGHKLGDRGLHVDVPVAVLAAVPAKACSRMWPEDEWLMRPASVQPLPPVPASAAVLHGGASWPGWQPPATKTCRRAHLACRGSRPQELQAAWARQRCRRQLTAAQRQRRRPEGQPQPAAQPRPPRWCSVHWWFPQPRCTAGEALWASCEG